MNRDDKNTASDNNPSKNNDEIAKGAVCGVTNFGAFIKLEDGREGLVHISELSNSFVKSVADYLKVGQEVKVKILGINKKGKLDLSIKQVDPDFKPAHVEENKIAKIVKREINPKDLYPKTKGSPMLVSLEDKIGYFIKKSDEKQLDFKKNIQSKQGFAKRKNKK